MGLFKNKASDRERLAQMEAEYFPDGDDLSASEMVDDVLDEEVTDESFVEDYDDDDLPVLNELSIRYKALVSRLRKYDNEKTDAIRMALLYLESGGKVSIKRVEDFIKD